MRLFHLPPTLLLTLLPILASAADTCSKQVTAKAGDTCASLSETAGISVSQFLRANPGVTTCANLAPGTSYCVDPTFASTPAATETGDPGGGIQVSKDGRCAGGWTCLGAPYGNCCSPHGWCGGTRDHCGTGCQAAFGLCGSEGLAKTTDAVSVPGGGSTTTTTAGSTAPPIGGGTTANGTMTTTVFVTRTVETTLTRTATATSTSTTITGVAVTTSVVLQTSVTTVTQISLTFISSTVTTIRTITITDAKLCRSSNAARATAWAQAVGVELPQRGLEKRGRAPEPVLPGAVEECQMFYRVKGDDSCEGIVARHGGALSLEQLYAWNRHLNGDCQGLWLEHWVCVGV